MKEFSDYVGACAVYCPPLSLASCDIRVLSVWHKFLLREYFYAIKNINMKSSRTSIKYEDKPNIWLTEENPHSILKKTASIFNVTPSTVYKICKNANYHL